jgi:hypothetical protein
MQALPTTRRRVEILVRVFDAVAVHAQGVSAYRIGPQLGIHPRHAHRYTRALVAAKVLRLVARGYVVLLGRDAAIERIGKFAAGGIHTRRREITLRHRIVAETTAQGLRSPSHRAAPLGKAYEGYFDD